jgi:uncharacterized protein (TIGR04222 family)
VNPFDLRGPAFLLFYLTVAVAVIAVVRLWRRGAEDGAVPPGMNVDPYAVAHLRGGAEEAIRVAVLALVDRGLLEVKGAELQAVPGAVQRVRRPLECAILGATATARTSYELPKDATLAAACSDIELGLRSQRLLPSAAQQGLRLRLLVGALLVLWGVAGIKVLVAMSRGHANVGFLIGLAVIAALVARSALKRPRTTIGDRFLADLRALFSGLEQRASILPAGGATNELALLAGVFGVAALAGSHRAAADALFPRATSSASSSSCGSSCSSSSGDGGGGGCGGGGCGGCGG